MGGSFQVTRLAYAFSVRASERQRLAKDGLRYWQRNVFRRDSGRAAYLMTVVAEGGFPMRLVDQENTHLNRYLKAVLNDYTKLIDGGADAFRIAAAHGERLPLTFRNDPVYQLAADTIEVIYEYAHKITALQNKCSSEVEAFDELEKHYPEWKQKLPILLESAGAQSLVNGLLRTAKKKQHSKSEFVLLNRFFKPTSQNSDCWKHGGKVELPSSLSKELIAQQVNIAIDKLPRRLELSIQFAHSLVPVASMTREKDDYYIYPYGVDSLSLTLDPDVEVSCFVMAYDGGKLGELTLRGGSALDFNLPLTCQMNNGRLTVIGSGSIRSALEFVYTFLPSEVQINTGNYEQLSWSIDGFDGRWVKVIERLHLSLTGDFNCTISPRTQSAETQLCTVVGQRQYSYETPNLPCYAGFPKVMLWQGGPHTTITKQQFYWSAIGKVANWKTAEDELPKGSIKYRIVIDNECVQSGKMIVLPETFSVKLQQGSSRLTGEIELTGLQGVQVHINNKLGVSIELDNVPGALLVTCIAENSFAGKLPLEVIWPDLNRATIYVPFPGQGANFVDLEGNDRSNKRQCMDDLIRLSAVAVCSGDLQNYELQGTLRASDIKGGVVRCSLSFTSPIHQQENGYYELPLVNVLTSIRNLFSYSADLDASVLLEIVSNGSTLSRIDVGQFSSELEFHRELGQIVHKDNLGQLISDSFDIQLISLAGGQVPEVQTAVINDEGGYAYQFSTISGDISPCMAVMQGSTIRSVRPCIVFSSEEVVEAEEYSELSNIFRLPSRWQRQQALKEYLNVVSLNADHEGWSEVLKAIRRFSEVHPDSLDLYEAIIDNPVVIAGLVYRMNKADIAMLMTWEDYIPFRWWQIPIASYIRAFDDFKIMALNQGSDLANIIIGNALTNLEQIRHFNFLSKVTLEIVLTHCSDAPVEGIYNQVKGMNSCDLFRNNLDGILKQQLFQSVGEADWPNGLNREDWNVFFTNEIAWLDPHGMGFRMAFLDAIIAQAYSIAFDEYLPRDFRAFICATREFNPQFFDQMMQLAVIVFYMSVHHGK
ncbi:STY4851/ECs_5259 family protein [Neptuniibacter marinus]|uniref:STY4851/ECs_5259 family protein n=1 Tax=Neptuniibacter marinus TaxID=1806670 RepID=UPI003B5C71C5